MAEIEFMLTAIFYPSSPQEVTFVRAARFHSLSDFPIEVKMENALVSCETNNTNFCSDSKFPNLKSADSVVLPSEH